MTSLAANEKALSGVGEGSAPHPDTRRVTGGLGGSRSLLLLAERKEPKTLGNSRGRSLALQHFQGILNETILVLVPQESRESGPLNRSCFHLVLRAA